MKKFLEVVAGVYAKLGKKQKITIVATVVLVVAFIVGVLMFSGNKDKTIGMSVLFDGLSASNSAAVVSILEKNQVKYVLKDEGTILVDNSQVYKQRLEVAAAGVLKNDKVGFEIFDKQEFGATDEEQRIKYQRALEGELARTIESLSPVNKASVHIAFGRDSLFSKEKTPTTASIVLNIHPGEQLKEKQISGIKFLVASSVSDLTSERVKIIDQDGVALGNDEGDFFDSELLSAQVKYKSDYERHIETKISNVLAPILGGHDRLVAKVTAEFDFSQENSQSEVYDPNSVARSENTLEEKKEGGTPKQVGGVPGAISNIGPVQGIEDKEGKETYTKNQSTINYEISKKIIQRKGQFALLKRLSIAVVVDGKYSFDSSNEQMDYEPIDEAELARIKELVQSTVGFDDQRGDTISVANLRFHKSMPAPTPAMRITAFVETYLLPLLPPAKFLFAFAIILFFYKRVVSPFMKKMLEDESFAEEQKPSEQFDRLEFDEEEDSIEKFKQARKKVEEQLGIDAGFSEDDLQYDILIERLRQTTSERSEEVANLLASLLRNDAEFNQTQKDG